MNSKDYDYSFNYVIIGAESVGKTTLALNFGKECIPTLYIKTKDVEVIDSPIYEINNRKCIFEIWVPENDFSKIIEFSKHKACAILMYDITNKNTLLFLKNNLNKFKEKLPESVVMVLVGNKKDLKYEREVLKEEGKSFANEHNMLFFEVSSNDLKSTDVAEIFTQSAKIIISKIDNGNYAFNGKSYGIFTKTIDNIGKDIKEKDNCCCGCRCCPFKI